MFSQFGDENDTRTQNKKVAILLQDTEQVENDETRASPEEAGVQTQPISPKAIAFRLETIFIS